MADGVPLHVSAERLLTDLERLATIGGRADGGIDRVAGSAADLEARRWLTSRIEEAGLEARMDEAMNVFGRVRASTGPWLLLGSHTDTVPAGGRLDGAYGVIAALEVLRTLHEAQHPAVSVVEVVSFFDEEGVMSSGLIGSRALLTDPHVDDLRGYLEIHIEQGPRLEAGGRELAVVEGIVGVERWDLIVDGEANHAGTTPFHRRHDAARAMARLVVQLPELLQAVDRDMVGNIGVLSVAPNSPNVVPGQARCVVELRSFNPETLQAAARRVRNVVRESCNAEGCTFMLALRHPIAPQPMARAAIEALSVACERSGRPWTSMFSGAGHDAGALAARIPAGMLFVPSKGGISHSPHEYTDDRLLVQGAQVLLAGALLMLEH